MNEDTVTDESRALRNQQLELVHDYLKAALANAKKCTDTSDDKRVLNWIEGTLEEFGDDVEDALEELDLG